MDLITYIRSRGFDGVFEGFSAQVPEQEDFLISLSSKKEINTVLEVGFNAGHSSELFLKHGCIEVTSFDIGRHPYVLFAKEYIDCFYPKRHKMILGNSEESIPLFSINNPGVKFDLIFIDGGHSYNTAISDLQNCKIFSHEQSIVVMDDVIKNLSQHAGFNVGPTEAWERMIRDNEVVESGYTASSIRHRGFAWGRYNLATGDRLNK